MMTVGEAGRVLLRATVKGDGNVRFTGVSTDSRTLRAGQLFVALRGPNFDGHGHAAAAAAAGAAAVMVEHPVDVSVPQIVVPGTLRALGALAAVWRSRFVLPVIAVTGSNGKTTVTQMLASILAAAFGEKYRHATRGNLNNEIGLPLMVCELSAAHRAAVLELGMNQRSEIARLAAIAQPTVALVNNAQREHQEFLATVEATAHENGAAIAALPPDGVAVFPADDACAPIWRQLAGTRRVLDFALEGEAAVTAQVEADAHGTALSMATPAGLIDARVQLTGRHNVHNALAAAACALAIEVPPAAIAAGLGSFAPVSGRGAHIALPTGALLIDDSYNANPDSVRAAIDLLIAHAPPRLLVLGDMGEVGSGGPAFHREVGDYARAAGVAQLFALGEATRDSVSAFGKGAVHFEEIEPLIERARIEATRGGTILVKGSRFMKMERVVQALALQRVGVH
jgi:UDP-N-acetylmuramoyl-tripeptide--D-alanyl-D-alanine ligase